MKRTNHKPKSRNASIFNWVKYASYHLLLLLFPISIEAQVPVGGSQVGTIEGNFSVDLVGRANYSMPLYVSPGINGLEPKLSIDYNSGGGNGWLGKGFTLGGLSSITRAGTNLGNSNKHRPLEYTSNDKLYLDGNLLVVTSGNPWANGTEYRTENEIFSKIIYRTTSTSPTDTIGLLAHFEVYGKDGLIYIYGGETGKTITEQNAAKAWWLTKVSDRFGNYIKYEYGTSVLRDTTSASMQQRFNETFLLNRIVYAGNDITGTSPACTINFSYEDRPDSLGYWHYFDYSKIGRRIKNIDVYNVASRVRTYSLVYDTSGPAKISKLMSVQEFGVNWEMSNATTFNWLSNVDKVFDDVNTIITYDNTPQSTQHFYEWNGIDHPSFLADCNGDGKADMIATAADGVQVSISNGDGTFTQPETKLNEFGRNQGWIFRNPRFVADVNGDGIADIIGVPQYGFRVSLGRHNGSFSPPVSYNTEYYNFLGGLPGIFFANRYWLADANGDGLTDFLALTDMGLLVSFSEFINGVHRFRPYVIQKSSGLHTQTFGVSLESPIVTAELNGDNCADIVVLNKQNLSGSYDILISLSNGDGTYSKYIKKWISYYPLSSLTKNLLGDINGDGLDDIMLILGANVFVSVNQGKGTFLPAEKIFVFNGASINPSLLDINGDGMDDLVMHTHTGIWYALARGNGKIGFYKPVYSGSTIVNMPEYFVNQYGAWLDYFQCPVRFADVDGNGMPDIFAMRRNQLWINLNKSNPLLVTRFVDGLNNFTEVTYQKMSCEAITKDTTAAYPLQDMIVPAFIVTKYKQSNGRDAFSTNEYLRKYSGYKRNLLKQTGSFSAIETIDVENSIATIEKYNAADYKYYGIPTAQEIRKAERLEVMGNTTYYAGQLLKQSVNYISIKSYGYWIYLPVFGYNWVETRRFPFIAKQENNYYDLNSSALFNYSTSLYTYDDYGNLLTQYDTYAGGRKFFTSDSVTNNTSDWLIGIINSEKKERYNPGRDTIFRKYSFEYVAGKKVLKSKVENELVPDFKLTTEYAYDAFGNKISEKRTGNNGYGNETRTDSARYSTDGRKLLYTKNALNHKTDFVYNDLWIKPGQITDPNNLSVFILYDGLGREKIIAKSDGSSDTIKLSQTPHWVQVLTNTNRVLAKTIQPSGGLPPTVEYYDKLGRLIQTEKAGFDGRKILVDYVYNKVGSLEKKSYPYFAGTSPAWQSFEYDRLGRTTRETTPIGTTRYGYNGLIDTVTNALNQKEIKWRDNVGNIVQSHDNNSQSVFFEYDAENDLVKSKDIDGNETKIVYNAIKEKLTITEPNTGISTTKYNAFGELYQHTNNSGSSKFTKYDLLGRVVEETYPGAINGMDANRPDKNKYYYDSGTRGVGKLSAVDKFNNGHYIYYEKFYYDNFGRPSRINYSGSVYNITYDRFGRDSAYSDSYGLGLKYNYNPSGYLHTIVHASGQQLYRVDEMDAFGNTSRVTYGNGVQTIKGYDAIGRLTSINAANGAVQNLAINYNSIGNVTSRTDYRRMMKDSFSFDNLNRIKVANSYFVSNNSLLTTKTVHYTNSGNIAYKSDVGELYYARTNNAGPAAVTSIYSGPNMPGFGYYSFFSYDKNGNNTSSSTFSSATYEFNSKPFSIQQNIGGQLFETQNFYTPSNQKYGEFYINKTQGKTLSNKYYLGKFTEEVYELGVLTNIRKFIFANGDCIGYEETKPANPGATTLNYFHKDHLGSIVEITTQNRQNERSYSYDTWGKPRNPDTWQQSGLVAQTNNYNSGFTGHLNLTQFSNNLVDMGGRVYNSAIGRFLSADPYVQDPFNTQSHNRYSYVMNDPVGKIDPSGFNARDSQTGSFIPSLSSDGTHYVQTPAFAAYYGPNSQSSNIGNYSPNSTNANPATNTNSSITQNSEIQRVEVVATTSLREYGDYDMPKGWYKDYDYSSDNPRPPVIWYYRFSNGMTFSKDEIRSHALTAGSFLIPGVGWSRGITVASKAIIFVAAKRGAGVYDLGVTLGRYVGQSKNIMGRVTSHFAKGGKLSEGELQNAVFHSMPRSTKLQREVYEQYLINKYGKENLLNARNPMGGRMDLYNKMIDDVIKQFNLPR